MGTTGERGGTRGRGRSLGGTGFWAERLEGIRTKVIGHGRWMGGRGSEGEGQGEMGRGELWEGKFLVHRGEEPINGCGANYIVGRIKGRGLLTLCREEKVPGGRG